MAQHDVGGHVRETDSFDITKDASVYKYWEREVHSMMPLLLKKGLMNLDEHRRAQEALPGYEQLSYYEKWAAAMVAIALERGTITQAELDEQLGKPPEGTPVIQFAAGDLVRVREENAAIRYRKPHLRTPGYIFGLVGRVERACVGAFTFSEKSAYRDPTPSQPLYRVRFALADVWEGVGLSPGGAEDTVDIEIFQPWLLPATPLELEAQKEQREERQQRHHVDATHHGTHYHAPPVAGDPARADCAHHRHGEKGPAHDHHDRHDHAHHPTSGGHDAAAEASPVPEAGPATEPSEHADAADASHIGTGAHSGGGGGDDTSHHHHHHHHHHGDGDEDDHVHEGRALVEQRAVDLEGGEEDDERRRLAEAFKRVLLTKGIITAGELREAVEALDQRGKKQEGPRVVARAWVDPEFRARLLADAGAAVAELGISPSNYAPLPAGAATGPAPPPPTPAVGAPAVPKSGTVLTALENTEQVHNLIVCTLCSCYPISILGLSPPWYKSRSYRARAVRDPRGVLAEFGTVIPPDVAVRVHDSTADLRYIVIPVRPAGTEGWSEGRLQKLVTRDSMIGVTGAKPAEQLEKEEEQAAAAAAAPA